MATSTSGQRSYINHLKEASKRFQNIAIWKVLFKKNISSQCLKKSARFDKSTKSGREFQDELMHFLIIIFVHRRNEEQNQVCFIITVALARP